MKSAVILFHSNNYAIWAKKVFERIGLLCQLISVPRHLSSDCGYCLKIDVENMTTAKSTLETQSIEYDRFETIED